VAKLYGEEPVILGLDTCDSYRSLLSDRNIKPRVRVAGLYNTGTNAFARALEMNFESLDQLEKHEVPWGKHVEVKYRFKNTSPPPKRRTKTTSLTRGPREESLPMDESNGNVCLLSGMSVRAPTYFRANR